MRLIQADCTIRYTGRCDTFLPLACRLIIVKDDGSVMIHTDTGIKPHNYMKSSKNIHMIERDGHKVLFAGNKNEELYVDLVSIYQDVYMPFPDSERDMVKTGTEDLLQEEIFDKFSLLVPGHTGVCREFETGKGPVDVFGMALDKSATSLIEVKRHAHRKDVYQVLKYGEAMKEIVSDCRQNGIGAIEAKQKGQHDEDGVMVPVDALENYQLFLASRKFARGTWEEARDHGVGIIEMPEEENRWDTDNVGMLIRHSENELSEQKNEQSEDNTQK